MDDHNKFRLLRIGEPTERLTTHETWSKKELEAHFASADTAALSLRGISYWWEDTDHELRWGPIMDQIEDDLLTSHAGEKVSRLIHTKCPIAVQVLDVLVQFQGEIGNGGLYQWIGNRAERVLAAAQALKQIGLPKWAAELHEFNSIVISLDSADLISKQDLAGLRELYPCKRKMFGRYDWPDADRTEVRFADNLHGAGTKEFAKKLRSYVLDEATNIPKLK